MIISYFGSMRGSYLLYIFLPFLAPAQDWNRVQIKTYKAAANIYYLEGEGGNIGVLAGSEGVLLIDNQYGVLTNKITTAIKGITSAPVTYIINTHYHHDHMDGNENFRKMNAEILAHKNVKPRLKITVEDTIRNFTNKEWAESYWPTLDIPFDEIGLKLYGEEIDIIHLPNCHTDGDVIIHFKKSNVIHAGDVFVRYGFPFIDVMGGGTIDGFIKGNERILELADEETKIIPGHGDIATVADVRDVLSMLKDTRKIIADQKGNGVALEDLIPMNPLKDYHDRWNGNFITTDLFVQLVYESL